METSLSSETSMLQVTGPLLTAELSKVGSGVHLHYLYDGDVDELSSVC